MLNDVIIIQMIPETRDIVLRFRKESNCGVIYWCCIVRNVNNPLSVVKCSRQPLGGWGAVPVDDNDDSGISPLTFKAGLYSNADKNVVRMKKRR